jgi:conjugative relaxase-like TrwC/TraI family protein
MLSISNVQNTKAAAEYYEIKDDYYTASGAKAAGKWSCNGAATLGLQGSVQHEQFIDLLNGRLPDGRAIHRAADGHRAGVDLTFSAPKSVSLMALLVGDERVAEAHAKAVDKAMKIAEERAGFRATSDGVTTHQRSGNLVVAQFSHELSRACDPQLHTHCVVLNMTRRPDGEWRALDNEPLYRAKMLLGAISNQA